MRSLQLKFALLVAALLAAGSVGLALIATSHERKALEGAAEQRGRILIRQLATAAQGQWGAAAAGEQRLEALEALAAELSSDPGVAALRVLDAVGRVAASSDPHERGAAGSPMGSPASSASGAIVTRREGAQLVMATTLGANGESAGEVQIALDLSAAVGTAVRDSALRLGVAAVAVVAVGAVACVVFAGLFVGPLRRLRMGVEQLAAGQLSVRVPPSSRDEVGELTRAFNEMGDALQQKARIQTAFGRYVSEHVLSQLLDDPDGEPQAGSEREVSVLFADIRRFTHLSEGLQAPRVVSLLNEIFQLVSDRILEQGGTIDKYMGDSVMAYFGAPVPHPDHPLRAVTSAIEILQAIEDRSRRIEEETGSGLPVDLGIGVHTGVVVVGNIGSRQRTDFTAVGDAVNVAHRLEKLARPGQVLVSEAVQRRVRGAVTMRFEGERQLSGREEPVHVYSIQRDGARKPHASAD